MKGYVTNIEKGTLQNNNFRKVLYTGKHSQLVLMSLAPKEEIGMEVHQENDQFFRFEKGQGKCIIDGNEYELKDGVAVARILEEAGTDAIDVTSGMLETYEWTVPPMCVPLAHALPRCAPPCGTRDVARRTRLAGARARRRHTLVRRAPPTARGIAPTEACATAHAAQPRPARARSNRP